MKKTLKLLPLCVLNLFILSSFLLTQQSADYTPDNVKIPGTSVRYPGMVAEDFDSDGADEIACDFNTAGIWLFDDGSTPKWAKISNRDPEFMIALDWDGDGDQELMANWGKNLGSESVGSWDWQSGNPAGLWNTELLGDYGVYSMYRADVDDSGRDELILHTDGAGAGDTLLLKNNQSPWWYTLYSGSTEGGFAATFSNPGEEVVVDFGTGGVKFWYFLSWSDPDFSTNWITMTGGDPDFFDCRAGEIDGDAEDEVVVDIDNNVWIYNHSSIPKWSKLNNNSITDVRVVNIDDDPKAELIFGFPSGMWYYSFVSGWKPMSSNNGATDTPGWMVPFDSTAATDSTDEFELAVDFQASGLWLYDTDTAPRWKRLTPSNPESMVKADWDGDGADELLVDFGSNGVWLFDDFNTPKWRIITTSDIEQE